MRHKGEIRFKLMERLRGTRALYFLDQFEKTQWWPRERLLEWQNERLRRLIKHIVANVPFYRDYFRNKGLKPGDIDGQKDLYKLPIVDKELISQNYSRFMADNAVTFKPHQTRTGGTTGTPFIFFIDRDSWSVGWAGNWRGWGWGGYSIGDKLAVLAGASLVQNRKETLLRRVKYQIYYNYLQNALPFSSFDISDEKLSGYVDAYKKFGAKYLRCYGQAGYMLAAFCRRAGVNDLRFRSVFPTSEQIQPDQRKVMEEQFGAEVYDDYGCYDGNLKAMECGEHRGFHMAMEMAIFEFLNNDQPIEPGETGEIVATSLYNYAMPFIRYRVGDLGVPSDEICSCGRELALIKRLEGRASDYVITPDGKRIHPHFFLYLFWDQDWLAHYQVRQSKLEEVIILLHKRREPTKEERKRMLAILRDKLGDGGFKIQYVDRIEPLPSGKRISIISKVDSATSENTEGQL